MEKRLSGWKRELLRAHDLIAGLFARSETRTRSLAYLQGLLSNCERKNGWQLAEWLGETSPYAVQHLLDRARWDADQVRDRVRSYALEEVSSAEAVLIVDERCEVALCRVLMISSSRTVKGASSSRLPGGNTRVAIWRISASEP